MMKRPTILAAALASALTGQAPAASAQETEIEVPCSRSRAALIVDALVGPCTKTIESYVPPADTEKAETPSVGAGGALKPFFDSEGRQFEQGSSGNWTSHPLAPGN